MTGRHVDDCSFNFYPHRPFEVVVLSIRLKITATIITLNEAEHIRASLRISIVGR